MSTAESAAGDEAKPPVADAPVGRPTVDEMSEWSFPASDPPATWNLEPRGQHHAADRPDERTPPYPA